jgi:hypothetical protein
MASQRNPARAGLRTSIHASHIGGAVASPVAETKCRARDLFDSNYSLRRIRCAD